jgi:GlcNAc-PI de-N-acetylase
VESLTNENADIDTGARNAIPPRGALLIVSPHFDDAALSCAALLDRSEPLDVLTVCAGAPNPPRKGWWDDVCGFESSAQSVPIRRREEEAALGRDGHRLLVLDLLEAQHFEGLRPAAEGERIVDAVRAWLDENRGGMVALPAGAGWAPHWLPARLVHKLRPPPGPEPHDDHVFVRDALVQAGIEGGSLFLYEELPYLWGGPAKRAARRAAAELGRRPEVHVVPVDRERKAQRLAAYTTQIPHLSPPAGRLDSPHVLPENERYWSLRRP